MCDELDQAGLVSSQSGSGMNNSDSSFFIKPSEDFVESFIQLLKVTQELEVKVKVASNDGRLCCSRGSEKHF